MFRKENGVTLVALVITIIVLLILAGVTISMVLDEDGILGQAKTATETHNLSDVKEKVSVAAATLTTKYLADKHSTTGTIATGHALTLDNLATETEALFEDGVDAAASGTSALLITLPNADKYIVNVTIGSNSISVGTAAATK